jgi:hypothetical protein
VSWGLHGGEHWMFFVSGGFSWRQQREASDTCKESLLVNGDAHITASWKRKRMKEGKIKQEQDAHNLYDARNSP